MKKMYSRRKFMNKILCATTVSLGGAWILSSCNWKTSQENPETDSVDLEAEVTSCDDLSGVSASEISKRRKLGYVEESPLPDAQCANCSLYIPPQEENSCGGCMLFEGPVFAEAYCTYWAPIG